MSAFYKEIAAKITVPYKRLSVLRNTDGFLSKPEVQCALTAETGIIFVCGTPMQLRLHFELDYKDAPQTRFCYLCDNPALLLPDIREAAHVTTFMLAEMFPNIAAKKTLAAQPINVLEALFDKNLQGNISASDLARYIMEIEFGARLSTKPEPDAVELLTAIEPNWADLTGTVEAVSAGVLAAVRQDKYNEASKELERLNCGFQAYADQNYFAALNSSFVLGPKSVNRILPYLTTKHKPDDKVALLVVDGMAYWQYLVLQEKLHNMGIAPKTTAIYAWIPTITMLSRQAIFRGDIPRLDYKQNPGSEEKLWSAWWSAKGVASFDIKYIYGETEDESWANTRRLAMVTVTLDEVMHIAERLDMLLACTESWARGYALQIAKLRQNGFTVYITTDHGNVLSTGTGALSSVEKTHLFQDGSRGARHLIYNAEVPMQEFVATHGESAFLHHDNWLAYRGTEAFAKPGKRQITHGGSHLLETAIPFIEIGL